jgi:DNA-binding GntR family transcriptional regulator
MGTRRASSATIFDALRADILSGRIRPGERLPFGDLCSRYDASVGAVRESLLRLGEQGLVRGEPQQGFTVTPISADDLRELTDARYTLEGLVLARAIQDGTIGWEGRLVCAHHVLTRTPLAGDADPARLSERWVTAHRAFHAELLAGCENKRLLSLATGLREAAELYRRWSFVTGSDRDIAKEHSDIVDAVLDRDADRAVRLLQAHIGVTTELLLAWVGDAGDLQAALADESPDRPRRRSARASARK